ncbi:MAG: DNA translocase FtsK 4TM domain-containing protein, partial [Anaerolineae bacterium]|nr:DNA translocase FtsK 4TM domain-containing protein [Anaerolineae bacterium]
MAAGKNKAQTNLTIEQFLSRLAPYQREIAGALILFLSIITLLSLLSLSEGTVSGWWADFFRQLFGWGAVPATVLLTILGGLLTFSRLKEEDKTLPFDMIIGGEILLIVGLALTHLMVVEPGEVAVRLAREGGGGGFIGWGVSNFMIELMGATAAIIFLVIAGVLAIGIIARFSFRDAAHWTGLVNDWAQQQLEEQEPDAPLETLDPEPAPAQKKSTKSAPAKAKQQKLPVPEMTVESALMTMPDTQRTLPPITLLAPPVKDAGQGANARYQAQIIEDTLGGFGIPAEVVEINTGPTVTQFGLKLGTIERKQPDGTIIQQRIRVNKVVALSNDLALALSAAPIRIEAPVPGRPLVGIEVPNTDKTMVSLRGVMESEDFQKSRKPLLVALGKGVSGQAVSASLSEMPHVLIAGATGSGKSVCINTLISTLLFTHAPEQLRFLMIDPKMVELTSYNGIPHLIAPVVTDFEQVVGALAWATREMERRYKLFAAAGARSLSGYNRKVGAKGERLPFLVIVIDELADLMMM